MWLESFLHTVICATGCLIPLSWPELVYNNRQMLLLPRNEHLTFMVRELMQLNFVFWRLMGRGDALLLAIQCCYITTLLGSGCCYKCYFTRDPRYADRKAGCERNNGISCAIYVSPYVLITFPFRAPNFSDIFASTSTRGSRRNRRRSMQHALYNIVRFIKVSIRGPMFPFTCIVKGQWRNEQNPSRRRSLPQNFPSYSACDEPCHRTP